MYRKTILVVVMIAIFLGAVSIFLLFNKSTPESEQIQVAIEESNILPSIEKELTQRGTDTLKNIIDRGENSECTIIHKNNGVNESITEGTLFTSRARLRGDFVTPDTEAGTVSSMIIDGNTMYSWSEIEGEKYGIKVDLSDLDTRDESSKQVEAREPVPLEVKVSYECKEWKNVDGSIFIPPTDLVFKDFNDLMKQGMEFGNIY